MIQDCLQKHESCYREVAGFLDQVAVFRRLAAKAAFLESQNKNSVSGETYENNESEGLIKALLVASGPMEGWAAILGDETLRCQVGAKTCELRAMGGGLTGHARSIWKIGNDSITRGASHYGLTQAMLDGLNSRILSCEGAPEERPPALRGAVDRLYFFLRDVMDPLVRAFLLSAPEFCEDYRRARKRAAAQSRATAICEGQSTPQDTVLSA
jgi:hypothetical protein